MKHTAVWLKKRFGAIIFIAFALAAFTGCGSGSTPLTSSGTTTSGSTGSTQGGTGSASLAWSAPTTDANGNAIADLAGYRIYYGTSPGNYTDSVDAGNNTGYVVKNLQVGTTYYFVVAAYDSSGNQSTFSNELSKTL